MTRINVHRQFIYLSGRNKTLYQKWFDSSSFKKRVITMNGISNIAGLIGRIILAVFWIYFGYTKIGGIEGIQGYMENFGIPGVLAWPVVALELGGGILLLLGFFSRFASLLLAGFCVMSAVIFHADFGNQTQLILFAKNIAIAGGLLLIVANGPGPMAINQK